MAIIGLQFLNAGYNEIADNSINNICCISKYYIERTDKPDQFSIANIIIHAWQLRLLAEHKGSTKLVLNADNKIQEVIDLASLKQVNIKEEFDTRKKQLDRHLSDYDPIRITTSSRDYLKKFLQNSDSKESAE